MNVAVVPAAGRSSRMGRSKALLPFGDSVVLGAVTESLRGGGADRLVVVGADGDSALERYCKSAGLDLAINSEPGRGMLSSIRCGVDSLAPTLAAGDTLIVCPVDYPLVRAETVRELLMELALSPHPIVVPVFAGRRGHPLLLDAELITSIATLDPRIGLRAILDRYPRTELEVDDPGVRRDLDTWSDHQRLLADRGGRSRP